MTPTLHQDVANRLQIWAGLLWDPAQRGLDEPGCSEMRGLDRPESVLDDHRAFLETGIDGISTDTFGATAATMAANEIPEAESSRLSHEADWASAQLARRRRTSTPYQLAVAGSSVRWANSPLTHSDGRRRSALRSNAARLLCSSQSVVRRRSRSASSRTLPGFPKRAIVSAIQQLEAELATPIPVMITVELDRRATTLDGVRPEHLLDLLPRFRPFAIGVTGGVEFLTQALKPLLAATDLPVAAFADTYNFAPPDGWHETPLRYHKKCRDPCKTKAYASSELAALHGPTSFARLSRQSGKRPLTAIC